MMHLKHVLPFLLSLALVVSFAAPTALPATHAQGDCGNAPTPRLIPGERASVLFTDGQPLNVRDRPGLSETAIVQLPEGTEFDVLDGPVCADDIYWWSIAAQEGTGWIAEGVDGEYFVGPLQIPTVTPGQSVQVVPFIPSSLQFATLDWDAFTEGGYGVDLNPFSITLPPLYSGDLPPLPVDLSTVQFVDDAMLNDTQTALLAQNGFVVVPGGFEQFYDAYTGGPDWNTLPLNFDWEADPEEMDIGHGYFVTTDAMLHALHFIFDNLLTDLERITFVPIITTDVLIPALASAQAQRAEVAGSVLEGPARDAELYLTVALELFQPGEGIQVASQDVAEQAMQIVQMAQAGSGQEEIPFLPGYVEDFSQYRPRGHYGGDPTLENYFRGMMWLSRITFRASNERETQIALMLLRALRGSQQAVNGWNTINDTLGFLVGPVDDLGPPEYSELTDSFYSPMLFVDDLADPVLLAGFREELKNLPGPRVNGLILPNTTDAADVEDLTRGFRFLGQRFTLDGYAMQQLMYPYVGTRENPRLLPLGLDVASAVGGSEIAYQLALQAGAGEFENYDVQTLKLASETGVLTDEEWLEDVYGGWLWTLRPLWVRDAAAYPPLMNTRAWLYKDLQTGLASWTELKHDTVLYAKQPTGFGGGGPPLTSFGYVEPNPLVFARIAIVAALTYEGLAARGLDLFSAADQMQDNGAALQATLDELRSLVFEAASLAEIARKELAGEPLSESDYWRIFGFDTYLYTLQYTLYQGEGEPDPVALVTDVASNPSVQSVLQEAVGGVDHIYVVVPEPRGGYQLVRGAVFSYYEWVGNINQRMTDAEWRAQVETGDLPPRPEWADAFFAE